MQTGSNKSKSIIPTKVGLSPNNKIKPTQSENNNVSFSLKYFALTDKFNFNDCDSNYFIKVIERIKALSTLYAQEIIINGGKSLRCHPIVWGDVGVTEKCFNIPNEKQLVDTPMQFEISANKHGRVHGFFVGSVFFIVWFDPCHKLYPGK